MAEVESLRSTELFHKGCKRGSFRRLRQYLVQKWMAVNYLDLELVKTKFHYADFHRSFPAGKVMDTNHESRGHKR